MFPSLHFIAFVHPSLQLQSQLPTLELRSSYFTEKSTQEFAGKNVLFICNIVTSKTNDLRFVEHMKLQLKFHELIRPKKSLLKFRLPSSPGKTNYLNGDIYLPICGRAEATETRLVPSEGLREYDHAEYNEAIFRFQGILRVAIYSHPLHIPEMDWCYDCKAEVSVLRDYVHKIYPQENPVENKIKDVTRRISEIISKKKDQAVMSLVEKVEKLSLLSPSASSLPPKKPKDKNPSSSPQKKYPFKTPYPYDERYSHVVLVPEISEWHKEHYKAAGILPYAYDEEGKCYVLLGKEYRTERDRESPKPVFRSATVWSEFGGKVESSDKGIEDTAIREFDEESNRYFARNLDEIRASLSLFPSVWNGPGRYMLFFGHVPFIPIRDFSPSEIATAKDLEKLGLQWFPIEWLIETVETGSRFTVERNAPQQQPQQFPIYAFTRTHFKAPGFLNILRDIALNKHNIKKKKENE
jgi:8-oxo-dGTP pyrophosphatase MutT (NUDIX family)